MVYVRLNSEWGGRLKIPTKMKNKKFSSSFFSCPFCNTFWIDFHSISYWDFISLCSKYLLNFFFTFRHLYQAFDSYCKMVAFSFHSVRSPLSFTLVFRCTNNLSQKDVIIVRISFASYRINASVEWNQLSSLNERILLLHQRMSFYRRIIINVYI